MELTEEQRGHFAILIDSILEVSDLTTISEKKIRKQIEEKLGRDLSDLKSAIKPLILERFDKYSAEHGDAAASASASDTYTNGANGKTSDDDVSPPATARPSLPKKRKHEEETDEMLAKRLQAEENNRARPTRGSANKKTVAPKKKATKKKSAAKIKAADDSDLDDSGEKKEVKRNGGFHKQLALSQPLVELLGETQLSRPQVVKKIWEYIKERDLQDPNDKRQIMCDDKLQRVFKQDKVHMFTMNKLLANQLYPIETEE